MTKYLLSTLTLVVIALFAKAQDVSLNYDLEYRYVKKLSVGLIGNNNMPADAAFMVGNGNSTKASMLTGVSDTSAIVNPVERMIIYSSADHKYYYRNQFKWVLFGDGTTAINQLRVSWNHDLVFDVTSGYYTIPSTGTSYYYAGGQVTLPNGGDDSRIDIIIAQANGIVTSIQGEEAEDPLKPIADDDELELTNVLILAGATAPSGVTSTVIWDENIGSPEWTLQTTGASANGNSTSNTCHGTKSTFVTSINAVGNNVRYVIPSGNVNIGNFSHIALDIRLTSAIPNARNISISLMNGNTIVSAGLFLTDFGLNKSLTGVCQPLVIPFAAFSAAGALSSTNITAIRYTREGGGVGNFQLDNIRFQQGITVSSPAQNAVRGFNGPGGTSITANNPNYMVTLGAGNGVTPTISGNTVTYGLGGTLQNNTAINGNNKSLSINNLASLSLISYSGDSATSFAGNTYGGSFSNYKNSNGWTVLVGDSVLLESTSDYDGSNEEYNSLIGKINRFTFRHELRGPGAAILPVDVRMENLPDTSGLTKGVFYNEANGKLYKQTGGGGGGSYTVNTQTLVAPAVNDFVATADSSNSGANAKSMVEDVLGLMDLSFRNERYSYFNDFMNVSSTSSGDIFQTNANGAFTASTFTGVATNRPGIARSETSTSSASARAYMGSDLSQCAFGGGAWVFETAIRPLTLSTSGERFQLAVGFIDNAAGADQTDGIYFLYDEGGVSSGSTAAAYWQTVTANNSTRTFNTSLTQTTVASGSFVKLRIEVNAAGTSVAFYINGSLVATHTANIPTTSSRSTGFGWSFMKSVGTGNRFVIVDYLGVQSDFSTAR